MCSSDLRTHILVCLGSCVFTLLSIHAFPVYAHSPQADPARIAAQILTGIGFIGGGTVLRHGYSIYGLTTAATLWITASIGMACGCSFRTLAVFATILSVGVLVLIRIFEKEYIHRNPKTPRRIKVSFYCQTALADQIYDNLMTKFKTVHEISEKTSPEDKIRYFYDRGFRALEDNGMPGRPREVQDAIAKTMEKLGMEMGVFVAHAEWGNASKIGRASCRERV